MKKKKKGNNGRETSAAAGMLSGLDQGRLTCTA